MSTTPNREAEIRDLEGLLNSGARSISVDGQTTTFQDSDQIRRRIAELRNQQGETHMVKPRLVNVNLGSAW